MLKQTIRVLVFHFTCELKLAVSFGARWIHLNFFLYSLSYISFFAAWHTNTVGRLINAYTQAIIEYIFDMVLCKHLLKQHTCRFFKANKKYFGFFLFNFFLHFIFRLQNYILYSFQSVVGSTAKRRYLLRLQCNWHVLKWKLKTQKKNEEKTKRKEIGKTLAKSWEKQNGLDLKKKNNNK